MMMSKVNKVVIFMLFSNLFLEAAFGLIAPVFSVFVVDELTGGSLSVAGFAAAIYWITKSILQLFVGRFLDRVEGEKDDIIALFVGTLIMGVSSFLYLFASTPTHIYGIQFILAIGGSMAVPPSYAIFSRHVDKLNETFEWSLNSSVSFGLGIGATGAVGGLIADNFGFDAVFIIAGVVGVISSIVIILMAKYLQKTHLTRLSGAHK